MCFLNPSFSWALRRQFLFLLWSSSLPWATPKISICSVSMSLSGMHIAFYKACSSSSTAGCCWTWSHWSVKPGTTSVLSDGPPRKRKREKRSVWRDGRGLTDCLTGEGRGLQSLQSLQRQSHWSLEVPAEASVSVQSSHSRIWTEDPGQWWQCGAPF